MRPSEKSFLFSMGLLVLTSLVAGPASAQGRRALSRGAPAALDQILERLQRIEEKLDAVTEKQLAIEEEMNAPSTVATFCISQGRGLQLAGELAAELQMEVGLGWPNIGEVQLDTKGSIPQFLPIVLPGNPLLGVPPIPIGAVPLPTAAKVELGGGIGRANDVCIDIPVKLSPEDRERVLQLAKDINVSPIGLDKSKYQRRANRLLNYVARHVPGIQPDPDALVAFDKAEAAFDSLMDLGFAPGGESGLDAFRDGSVKDLLGSLDVPVSVASFMNDPEQIFDALPDLGIGSANTSAATRGALLERIDDWTCDELGLTPLLTRERPYESLPGREPGRGQDRLERVCALLENDLPEFSNLRDAFIDFPQGIVEAVGDLFEKPSKNTFCDNHPSRLFNRYCGRND